MKKLVVVQFEIEGLHKWPGARDDREDYLQYLHRHLFKIKVKLPVTDSDREIEFIGLKRRLQDVYRGLVFFDTMSCEVIADDVAFQAKELSGVKPYSVEVYEDGDCGAEIIYDDSSASD